jgi:hypothetical protein
MPRSISLLSDVAVDAIDLLLLSTNLTLAAVAVFLGGAVDVINLSFDLSLLATAAAVDVIDLVVVVVAAAVDRSLSCCCW